MHFVSKRNCIYRKDHPPDGIDITSPTKESGIYSTLNEKKDISNCSIIHKISSWKYLFYSKISSYNCFFLLHLLYYSIFNSTFAAVFKYVFIYNSVVYGNQRARF